MTEVVSIRFRNRGKLYFFDPNGVDCAPGEAVVVETAKGLELGECAKARHPIDDDKLILPLRPVIRVATEEDLRAVEAHKAKAADAQVICRQKIADHGLDMKLVDVEYNLEGSKIVFYFTSDGRVDFRELVKDLASVFRMRIELRQIGVRDEAKMIGGLGICGKTFCCAQFLDDFQPVSTKMAKTQSLSLNPTKISGSCGRLMCCLRYEQEAYEDLISSSPKSGAYVNTPAGPGVVERVQLLRQRVNVRIDGAGEQILKVYDTDEIAVVPGGKPKPGEPERELPKLTPKVKELPEEPAAWPSLISDAVETWVLPEADSPPLGEEKPKPKNNKNRKGRGKGKPAAANRDAAQPSRTLGPPKKSEVPKKTHDNSKKPIFHKPQGDAQKKPEVQKKGGRFRHNYRRPSGGKQGGAS